MKKKFIVVLLISLFMFMPYKVSAYEMTTTGDVKKINSNELLSYYIKCDDVYFQFDLDEIDDDNDFTANICIISTDSNKIKKEREERNNLINNAVMPIIVKADTCKNFTKIDLAVKINYSNENTKTCSGSIEIKDADESVTKLKATIRTENPSGRNAKMYTEYNTVHYSKGTCSNNLAGKKDSCTAEYDIDLPDKLKEAQETGENTYDIISKNSTNNSIEDKSMADLTPTSGATPSEIMKSKCDKTLKDLIKKYWKWIIFLVPILLIVMITMDFLKAMATDDADAIKKSSTNAFKRAIAAIILIMLPWALDVIFDWFGLQICF